LSPRFPGKEQKHPKSKYQNPFLHKT
jgi:hypothetical protein